MPIEVKMPRLSDTMETGTVVKWNVKEGDAVSAGDVLADIETDKATMELQSYDDGTVARILINEGESVEIGNPILVLAEEDEDVEEAASSAAAAGGGSGEQSSAGKKKSKQGDGDDKDDSDEGGDETSTAVAEPPSSAESRQSSNGAASHDGERIFASPLARKIAEAEGVDLSTIEGTGPSNRIIKRDVEAAIRGEGGAGTTPRDDQPAAAPAQGAPAAKLERKVVELSNMRRTIAKRLVESKQTIPHYQVTVSVNMDPLLELRSQLNGQLKSQDVKLSVNDFLVRACAVAMHQHPFVNSRWSENNGEASIEVLEDVNVGVAIALPGERGGGLVVATLRNTDRMGLRQISQQTKQLAEKARRKGLTVEEMSDSTFTISNLGMFGVEHFTAIINPPNVCILAVGAAVQKPVVRDGEVVVGHEMQMTMSSDHRVVDGAMASEYLNTVKEMLENPATLLV